jgi:hypothetical protein
MERQIHIKDRISKFYRNEFTKISTIFGDLLTKFQDVYNKLFNKVLETHKENKTKVIDFGDQLLDLKGDVLNLVRDVEDNYEKIVINMDLTPFEYIMQNYSKKVGEMRWEIDRYFNLQLQLKQYKLLEYKESIDTVKNLMEKIFTASIEEKTVPVATPSDFENITKRTVDDAKPEALQRNDKLNDIFSIPDDDILNSINMSST